MRYNKIVIENYKAITSPIVIDFKRKSLFPIIGVNECGKTTILNAIFAFDEYNDDYDNSIHHLTDVENLYSTSTKPAVITAYIEISKSEFRDLVSSYLKSKKDQKQTVFRFPKKYSGEVIEIGVSRIIKGESRKYKFKNSDLVQKVEDVQEFTSEIISSLPYILYFDDFRDSFPDKVEISRKKSLYNQTNSTWKSIIQELFKQTNPEYKVYSLPELESRRRKSVLGDVARYLNRTLTKEWANFKLEEKEPLQIAIEFFTEEDTETKVVKQLDPSSGVTTSKKQTSKVIRNYLKFEVIDKDPDGNERYFYVRDRSKGFYWFFNFVMKLEFNPKINGSDNNAIYLLDEPGSYLHSFAQTKLCKKLKLLSDKHKVLYCTHSHYLLNPEVIPLNLIQVASKTDFGEITLAPYHDYKVSGNEFPTAFQTIFDALHSQPIPYELMGNTTLLVEGIYDFYALKMLAPKENINIVPCKGAGSISKFISLMLGFQISYKALWDNDPEGIKEFNEAKKFFGEQEAENNFYLLPMRGKSRTVILQDLFTGNDMKLIRNEVGVSSNASFNKVVSALFFYHDRDEVLTKISNQTKDNFENLYIHLGIVDKRLD